MKPQAKLFGVEELREKNFWGLATPLHVLVGSGNARKVNQNMHCHVYSGEFPDGSFVRMDSGLIVSSPELCFMQMADELSFIGLVALGYELCGSYRLGEVSAEGKEHRDMTSAGANALSDREAEKPKMGFRRDFPLTSLDSLSSYTARAAGLKGRKNALRALRYIAERSASPMETILSMLLTLPYSLGGYGFPKPMLNYRIEASAGAGKTAGKVTDKSKHYYCDLYWPEKKVDVEYDSDAFHTGSDRIAQDAIRRNALSSMGLTVISVSRKHVFETLKMRELAHVLSKLLGKRMQFSRKEFAYRHAKLREQLLPKMSADSYGAGD